MKLLVDGQLFQTGALERGMGTLTIELLRAAQKQDASLKVKILLNDKLPTGREHAERLRTLLDGFEMEYVSLETPATGPESRAKTQLEQYIRTQITDDEEIAYLVPALFLFDYFALFPKACKTILIFHDLIPLVMWDYLKNVFPGNVYFARFSRVFEADIILANSENTKQELVRLLGAVEDNVVVMGGAPEAITLSKADARKRVKELGISKPYVLLPTGGGYMHHKNNMRAAEALYLLKRDTDREFVVVATSRYEDHEREAMRKYLGDNIVFTGNISTIDVQALYCCADVVLTPALSEGLGIPLLNTVSQGIPVAASRIPVYTELSGGEPVFYEFDPLDVWEMRDALLAALARVGFGDKQVLYKKLLERYTWDNCAVHLLAALQQVSESRPEVSKQLNVLIPDPLANTQEGYMAQSLFAAAAAHGYHLRYYIDPGVNPRHYDDRGADYLRYVAETHEITKFAPNSNDTPTLVFLPQDANFARLHLLARVIDGAFVYISGNVSHRLYDAMVDDKIIDTNTAEQEKAVQGILEEAGMYNVPHPLRRARGILVEQRSEAAVTKLLAELKIDCPVQVVADNRNKDLNDYVHQAKPGNTAIIEFIERSRAS